MPLLQRVCEDARVGAFTCHVASPSGWLRDGQLTEKRRRRLRPPAGRPGYRPPHLPPTRGSPGIDAGGHADVLTTNSSSKVTLVLRFNCTMRATHTLGEVLVRSADNHTFDTASRAAATAPAARASSASTPPSAKQRCPPLRASLQAKGTGPTSRFDPFPGLIAWPESVSERLDDLIGRNGDVRGAVADHS